METVVEVVLKQVGFIRRVITEMTKHFKYVQVILL